MIAPAWIPHLIPLEKVEFFLHNALPFAPNVVYSNRASICVLMFHLVIMAALHCREWRSPALGEKDECPNLLLQFPSFPSSALPEICRK